MNAWMTSARPTAMATVTTNSMIDLAADFEAFFSRAAPFSRDHSDGI
jgi:hypothetical protein